MPKKTLNLQIFEFEQLADSQASVSLMPCPCGASGGGSSSSAPKFNDYITKDEAKVIDQISRDMFPKQHIAIFGPVPGTHYGNVKGFELSGGVQNIGGIGTK